MKIPIVLARSSLFIVVLLEASPLVVIARCNRSILSSTKTEPQLSTASKHQPQKKSESLGKKILFKQLPDTHVGFGILFQNL